MKKIRLCFATNNPHKLEEVAAVLPPQIELLSLNDIACFEELPEHQTTIEGNAFEKAAYVYQKYGIDCFADDTGLEVAALQGGPGVDTAHYAGPERSALNNMALLLRNMEGLRNRQACFRTIFCLFWQGEAYSFEGRVEGSIAEKMQGKEGFGYDPVFVPEGYGESFAELGAEVKNRFSHRPMACRRLMDFLQQTGV